MTNDQIYDGLTDLFRDIFADDTLLLQPHTTAADIHGWDSFMNLNLMVAVEGRFGVRFRTAEIEQLRTVGDLASKIAEKLRPS